MSMSKVDAHIILYADDYSYDVWEDYCHICGVGYDSTEINIGFNYDNVEAKTDEDDDMDEDNAEEDNSIKCEHCWRYFPEEEIYFLRNGTALCEDCYELYCDNYEF